MIESVALKFAIMIVVFTHIDMKAELAAELLRMPRAWVVR